MQRYRLTAGRAIYVIYDAIIFPYNVEVLFHDVLGYGMFDTEAATELMRVGYQTAKEQLTEDVLRRIR